MSSLIIALKIGQPSTTSKFYFSIVSEFVTSIIQERKFLNLGLQRPFAQVPPKGPLQTSQITSICFSFWSFFSKQLQHLQIYQQWKIIVQNINFAGPKLRFSRDPNSLKLTALVLPVSIVTDKSGDPVELSSFISSLLSVSVGQKERCWTVSNSAHKHSLL